MTGAQVRARNEALNRKLAALGIHTLSRCDKSPRLAAGDWDRLAELAEIGSAMQAMKETWRKVFPEDTL